MTEGLNKVLLIGHLGQQPDLRYTQSGKAVCNLSLAVTTSYYDSEKERRENTEWIKVTVWGSMAGKLSEQLSVGARVSVEGSLRTNKWTDKNGVEREQTVVNASHVYVVGGGRGESADRGEQQADTEKQRPERPQHRERYVPNGRPSDDEDKWF